MDLLLLLLLGLCPRLLPARWVGAEQAADSSIGKILLALPVGLLGGLALLFWFSRFYLDGWTGADFQAYCTSVASLREGELGGWYFMRSVGAGILPALLAHPLGVLDGIGAASLLSTMGMLGGLYLWGLALGGWRIGLAMVMVSFAVGPLALLPRLLSFYPEVVAGLVLGSALCVLAWRLRTIAGVFVGGVGLGLCLLIDARGLLWALPGLLLVLGAAWRSPGKPLWRAGALLGPLLLAWFLGGPLYGPTLPLEGQTALMLKTNGVSVEVGAGGYNGYRWGHSNPLRIPQTLWTLAQQGKVRVEQGEFQKKLRESQVDPWLPPLGAALLLSLLSLGRGVPGEGRAERLPMLLPILPFVLAFFSAARLEPADRFLAVGMPFVPVLLALAWGYLSGRGARREWLGLGVLLLLVGGILPSWLSPTASWRHPFLEMPEAQRTARIALGGAVEGHPPVPDCLRALQGDVAAGKLPGPLVPVVIEQKPP